VIFQWNRVTIDPPMSPDPLTAVMATNGIYALDTSVGPYPSGIKGDMDLTSFGLLPCAGGR
jgi:hypothetical protein